jgi:hypothetical protein
MAFHHSPRIVSEDLVFAWDVPNKKSYPGSGTALNNLIAGGEDLTIINATAVSGSTNGGGSIAMDGSGDYLSFAATTFADVYTFSIWHKAKISTPSSSDPYGYGYLFAGVTPKTGIAFSEGGTSGALSPGMYYLHYNGISSNPISTAIATNDTWGHITVVIDTTSATNNIKFYWNGVLHQTTSFNTSQKKYSEFGRYDQTTWYVNGELAACTIHNRELSATEVAQNYNALKGRFG